MVLPASPNQISLKDIAEEKKGSGAGSGQYFENISLKGLSVDGVTDFSFYNGDTTITADYPGSPNQTAPYGVGEFHGYAASFWPASSPGSITTNETFIMDIQADDDLGGDVTACTVLNMSLNTTAKTLSWFFGNDADRGQDTDGISKDITKNTNTNTINYNGTITSLQARMVYTNLSHSYSGGGSGFTSASFAGRSWAAHNTNSHMDGSYIYNNGDSQISGVQKTKLSGTDGVYTRLPLTGSYGYKTMRTTTGNCSIGMFATTEDVGSTTYQYSGASIGPTASGSSIYWQIRANNSELLTIYTKTNETGALLVADTDRQPTT
jgi:hypothetical protein